MSKRIYLRIICFAVFCLLALAPFIASAYTIKQLPNVGVFNDFALEGGKKELSLDPGQSAQTTLVVINRSGQPLDFSVSVEDFQGTEGANLDFLGTAKGQYSLKEFIFPEVAKFSLLHGERIELPVTVKVPKDAQPGGLYGAVMITASDPKDATAIAAGQIKPVSRLASLYFVRVNGEVKESGTLTSLAPEKKLNEKAPINVKFSFKNDGNIYLTPSGIISLYGLWGRPKETIQIPAYFVMPGTTRTQIIQFKQPKLGWYRVKLTLNPGYGNVNISKNTSFWVLPLWLSTILVIIIVTVIIGVIIWLNRRRNQTKTHEKQN